MTMTPLSSDGTSRRPAGPPALAVSGLVGFLVVLFLTVNYAQQTAPSGEEVYVDRLGCWNCHGKTGQGGGGSANISKTRLPLRRFVSYVRLPSKEMPPFSDILASDAELAIVYRWLDGVEVTKAPPAITLDLKSSTAARADGLAKADVGVELTVLMADTAVASDVPGAASLGYRITFISNANAPLANQAVEYQLAGREDWSKLTTDEHGEALLSAGRGFVVARTPDTRARLRTALPAGKTALLVEALDWTAPAAPVVVGIGTAILKVD
jgi:mono/diheme cytochrome c family protein